MRFFLIGFVLLLSACATLPPPQRIENICHIFNQYPHWYVATQKAQQHWGVPIDVQMAIMYQESKFQADARPPFQFLLGVIPIGRPSTAYGYTQALDGTWDWYQKSQGHYFASRENFEDGVDFIAWYINVAHRRAKIAKNDAYHLYLAYHEGIGGYLQQTYLRKPWLMRVSHHVAAQAAQYRTQLQYCKQRF